MNFRLKHQPETVNDLVFLDPYVAQIISDYAAGLRAKHLLLEGPTSSGKSIAASMIVKARLSPGLGPDYASTYHGQGLDRKTMEDIEGDWNLQAMSGSACSVIDEVDFASADGRREIRKFIDRKTFGTLICTTNFLNKLEDAFRSRFYVVHIAVPAPAAWHTRALQILQSEGHAVTMAQVQRLMSNFSGHARDFMDTVEDMHLALLRARSAAQQSSSVPGSGLVISSPSQPSVTNGSFNINGSVTQQSVPPANSGKATP